MPDAPNAEEILKVVSAIVLGPVMAFFSHVVVFYIFRHESALLFLIIPIAVLSFGYFMMRKNIDFQYLEITVKFAKSYFKILLILAILFAIFLLFLVFSREASPDGQFLEDAIFHVGLYDYSDELSWETPAATLISLVASYASILAIQRLYFDPLSKHKQWIAERGIFSKEQSRSSKSSLVAPDQAKDLRQD